MPGLRRALHRLLLGFFMLGALAFGQTDVSASRYPEAVRLLIREGVLNGYPDGNFRPEAPVSRAELVATVMRGSSGSSPASEPCFTDVPINAWYGAALCRAKAAGLVAGLRDGTFEPARPATLAETLKLLLGGAAEAGTPWYAPYVERSRLLGLPLDKAPEATVSRDDLALLLYGLRQYEARATRTALPSSGCGASPPALDSFDVRGGERFLISVLPEGYNAETPYRLFLAFHGRTSPNTQVRRYYGLEPATGDAIFVYPEGLRSGGGFTWSVSGGSDLELFDTLLDTLARSYCIDLARVYVVGHSLGAYYANDLACTRGDRLRGVATLGGGLTRSDCRARTAALILHNPNDRLVPVAEGERARDTFLTQNGLRDTEPVAYDEGLNCVRYREGGLYPVVWCPHGVDYAYNGDYYPHTWPRETGELILRFFSGLEPAIQVAR